MTSESGPGSAGKRHNPVDSICRKIKTIQMRNQECNPILQIPKFQSRNFDSPQNNDKKNLEVALKNRTVKSCDRNSISFSSPCGDSIYSQTRTFSPCFMPVSDCNATYSIIVTTKEKSLTPWLPRRSQSCSTPLVKTAGMSYGLHSCSTPSLDLMSCIDEDQSAPKSPNCSLTAAKSEYVSFRSALVQSPVVKRLSLNEGGLRLPGEKKLETTEVSLISEEDLLDSIFHACDIEHRGKVPVSKILDYLRYTTSRGSEDSGLDDLCNMLDPNKKDISMDLDTYHAIMKEWIDDCRNNGGDTTTKEETAPIEDCVFKMRGSMLAAKRRSGGMNTTSGSLEAFGGDVSRGDLETSDLITCVADLQLNNQKLEVQHGKLKLALEGAEEANNRLMEENEMLHNQLKNVHQYMAKVKSLKEELEEVKSNLNSTEDKRAQALAHNKQLEKENISLIHKISSLQEENTQCAVDVDNLQRKMAEVLGNVAELQMQLQDYENIMAKKDASLQTKELQIDELKSTVAEYSSVLETLRAEKAKVENSMQQMQQELISHGIVSPIALTFNQSLPEERTSLHSEMVLAEQSPETNGETMKFVSNAVSPLDETFDHEVLLLLQGPGPEKAAVEFKMIIQKLREDACNIADLLMTSLRREIRPEMGTMEMYEKTFEILKQELKVKRVLWIQRLKVLEQHKGSLDFEFAKTAGNVRRLRTELVHLKKALSSRAHDLESQKQLREEEVEKAEKLGQQLQEAAHQLQDARKLVLGGETALRSARSDVESVHRKLEEAVLTQRALQAINSTLSDTCRELEVKTKEQRAFLDAMREKLFTAQVCGLLCQTCANWKPDDSSFLAQTEIQEPANTETSCCLFRKFRTHEAFQCMGSEKNPFRSHPRCCYTPLLDALTLEILPLKPKLQTSDRNRHSETATPPTFEKTEFLFKRSPPQAKVVCDITKCKVFSVGTQTDAGLPAITTMASQCAEDNIDQLLMEVNEIGSRDIQTLLEAQDNTPPNSEGVADSSDLQSLPLGMEMKSDRSNVSQESGMEKCPLISASEEQTESGSKNVSETGPTDQTNQLNTTGDQQETSSQGLIKLNLENSEKESGQETPTESKETCTAGGITSTPAADGKTVKFETNDKDSPGEREMEAEFLRLSLGFKCDLFTLEKRLRLEERSRDLAEENLKKEITNCLKLLETLVPICEEDNQSHDIIKKLEKSLQFLSQHTARVASRAEMLGAIHQESRVSKVVDVMIQHVENLKRMYAKEHAELEELKLVLLQNEKSFGSTVDEDEALNKKLPSSIHSKSLRRVSIATFPPTTRNLVTGFPLAPLKEITGAEKSDTFARRSSSWRKMGSKSNENRPSLQRLSSTYGTDGEEHFIKGQDKALQNDEVKAHMSHVDGNKQNAKQSSMFSSWTSHFRTSFSKGNKTLWISFTVMVLLAALMSFLAGLYFQRHSEAAPLGIGDSWTSLQQLLWPYTGLRHNGQPPV
ncbi:inositol 1,4,5-triphosphate receptor associated 2 isoform X2 [Lissotriton helveticus]